MAKCTSSSSAAFDGLNSMHGEAFICGPDSLYPHCKGPVSLVSRPSLGLRCECRTLAIEAQPTVVEEGRVGETDEISGSHLRATACCLGEPGLAELSTSPENRERMTRDGEGGADAGYLVLREVSNEPAAFKNLI